MICSSNCASLLCFIKQNLISTHIIHEFLSVWQLAHYIHFLVQSISNVETKSAQSKKSPKIPLFDAYIYITIIRRLIARVRSEKVGASDSIFLAYWCYGFSDLIYRQNTFHDRYPLFMPQSATLLISRARTVFMAVFCSFFHSSISLCQIPYCPNNAEPKPCA